MRAERVGPVFALGLVACGPPPLSCGDGQLALDLSGGDGAFLYTDGALPILALGLDDEALAGLARSPREEVPDVHATFGFVGEEGPETWDVGLHLKGHSSFRPIEQKAAFKIDFQEWDSEASFHGVRHLTLNNMNGDPSMLSEHLSYRAYALAGLPAARHGYACVVVNGADYGLYGLVETMDQQFLDRAFPDPGGNLYEGTFGADIRPGGTAGYIPQVINDVPDRSDLAALAAAFRGVTPEDALDRFAAHFDLDELLDAWALEVAIGNRDGYLVMQNNYLLYHQPSLDRWSFLPWGADENFTENEDQDLPAYLADEANFGGALFRICLKSPDCRETLVDHLIAVAGLFGEEDLAGHAAAQIDRICEVSRGDAMSPAGSWETRRAQEELRRWIEGRGAQISSQLGG